MINTKKIIMVCMLTMMIYMLSGCGETATTEPAKSPYIGGTRGIVAEFLDMGLYNTNTKINEIYQDESFPLEMMLRNKGEYEVKENEVTVRLKGIYLPSFSNIVSNGELSNDRAIEQIHEYNSEGGEHTLDFTPGTGGASYISSFSGASVDFDIFAEIEYVYRTEAVIQRVCFKENLQDKSICTVDETKKIYSSGAPIQAISAKQATAGTGLIAVTIDVQNMGGGDVAIIGDDFDLRYQKFAFHSSNEDKWECRSGGRHNEGRFDSAGKATIICKTKQQMDKDTLYTEDLGLTINYKYRNLIQNSIRIKSE